MERDPDTVKRLLEELLAAARADKTNTLSWWFKTEALVRSVWGLESPQYHGYREIPLLQIYNGMVPGTFGDRELQAAKRLAESYLEGLLFEVTNFGLATKPEGGP